ncbi:MAG TPA: hypothetical protein VGC56_01525 [Allosphingosinicella sp.]|jgi:hypothetical protein
MDEAAFLTSQAAECRRAAGDLADGEAKRGLEQLARHYDREAKRVNVVELRTRA